jgi:hypothetical protein
METMFEEDNKTTIAEFKKLIMGLVGPRLAIRPIATHELI